MFVTGGGLALIALTLWFFFGKREEAVVASAALLFACPMHPWISGDDPTATCSICGMKLTRRDGE
jgi:hypothetical protein